MVNKILVGAVGAVVLGAAASVWGSMAVADLTLPTSTAVQDAQEQLPESAKDRLNAAGQTYGSEVEADYVGDEPDLILVIATNGREGYVYKEQLAEDLPKNPQEAAVYDPAPKTMPVYLSDGQTAIGEFTTN